MEERSPAQLFGLVIGITLVAAGILGFFYNADRRDASYDDRVILIGTIEIGDELLGDLETGPVRVELIP